MAALEGAKDLVKTDPGKAVEQLRQIVFDTPGTDVETIKVKEQAIGLLGEAYVKLEDAHALRDLLSQLRPFFVDIPKAKTAKIVRGIVDQITKVPNSTELQVEVCREQVEWARNEKRTFLRQRLELRLASLCLETQQYTTALGLLSTLLSEVKRLDDKLLLVDVELLESRVHHALRNLPKARSALTAARTAANAIYVPVMLQAEIDTQSGVLHAEERDFKTAYSYFFEAFEQLSSLGEAGAVRVLKYMLLCKVMLGDAGDVPAIVAGKAGLRYAGPEVEAMTAVAKAAADRSLQDFQEVLQAHSAPLVDDPIVHAHLTALYDALFEKNLVRLIEPYSRVQVGHIAALIRLPEDVVEAKLSQMILDQVVSGTLDQGSGCLEVWEAPPPDRVYAPALGAFESLSRVVDTLMSRSLKVAAV